ncbi:transcription factor 24 [Aplochiton taeniatus]
MDSETKFTQHNQPGLASHRAPYPGQRQVVRTGRELRKWVRSGSRSSCGSGSGSGSVVQSRVLRSQHSPENAARERSRVRNLRQAFHSLQAALPSVPRDTKLSKLDVLVLATNYIAHLTETLDQGGGLMGEHTVNNPTRAGGYLHPVKKWPMRSLLYCGAVGELITGGSTNQTPLPGEDETHRVTTTPEVNMED